MSDFTNEAIQVARRLEEIAERLADCDLVDHNEADNLYYERAELEEKDRYLSAYFDVVNKNQQLKQRELELMAQVERLELACELYDIELGNMGISCPEADAIANETPQQSLAHIQAEAIEKAVREVRQQIHADNEFGSIDACYTYKLIEYANLLRQQADKG